jgi:hypothetical protein
MTSAKPYRAVWEQGGGNVPMVIEVEDAEDTDNTE